MSDLFKHTFPENRLEVTVQVAKLPHVANVQTEARSIAKKLGFSELDVCKTVSSASELASNLVYHASGGGSITIREIRKEGFIGIEIVSIDDGPGIKDVELALQDGFSTGPGLGSGLPAVKRAMDEVEILVKDGSNTCVKARIWCSCE